MVEQKVILVDRQDREIGLEGKIAAHKKGMLHRAISVYIFNSRGQLMLQKRAKGVYHSELLWSNTCCSNCYEGESAEQSAHRSLRSEMGFDCELTEAFTTIYKTPVGGGLTENEFLHVFFGSYSKSPTLNKKEAADWKWVDFLDVVADVNKNSSVYSAWLKILVNKSPLCDKAREFMG
jgi:isopentenyl-diphosphate Delta-isomerase